MSGRYWTSRRPPLAGWSTSESRSPERRPGRVRLGRLATTRPSTTSSTSATPTAVADTPGVLVRSAAYPTTRTVGDSSVTAGGREHHGVLRRRRRRARARRRGARVAILEAAACWAVGGRRDAVRRVVHRHGRLARVEVEDLRQRRGCTAWRSPRARVSRSRRRRVARSGLLAERCSGSADPLPASSPRAGCGSASPCSAVIRSAWARELGRVEVVSISRTMRLARASTATNAPKSFGTSDRRATAARRRVTASPSPVGGGGVESARRAAGPGRAHRGGALTPQDRSSASPNAAASSG